MSMSNVLFGIYLCYKVYVVLMKLQFHWVFLFSPLTAIL